MRAKMGLVSIIIWVKVGESTNYSAADRHPKRGFAPQISGQIGGMSRHTKIS